MEGHPAWMASISLRGSQEIINAGRYTMQQMRFARETLNKALRGAGDPGRERLFRTNLCLFLHRVTSETERDQLACKPATSLATLPLQVYYTRGLPRILSTEPCANPGREIWNPSRTDLWVPQECGECETCRDRTRRRQELGA